MWLNNDSECCFAIIPSLATYWSSFNSRAALLCYCIRHHTKWKLMFPWVITASLSMPWVVMSIKYSILWWLQNSGGMLCLTNDFPFDIFFSLVISQWCCVCFNILYEESFFLCQVWTQIWIHHLETYETFVLEFVFSAKIGSFVWKFLKLIFQSTNVHMHPAGSVKALVGAIFSSFLLYKWLDPNVTFQGCNWEFVFRQLMYSASRAAIVKKIQFSLDLVVTSCSPFAV